MKRNAMSAKRIALLCTLVMLTLTVPTLTAQNVVSTPLPPLPYDNQLDPAYLLASYYNAIALRDYARAYGYWEREPNGRTLAQFTQGFGDTASAEAVVRLPFFTGGAAGSIYASLPTMVIAQRTDGTEQAFVGCFTARRSNVPVGDNPEPDPRWWLYDASLKLVNTADLSLLETACELRESLQMAQSYDDALDPLHLLISYFNAIARQEYLRAYGYWDAPFQTYTQFTQGYTQTTDVGLMVRLSFRVEGAAGSFYASIPTLVTATLRDGTQQVFAGCHTMRRDNVPVGNAAQPDPTWRLYNPTMERVVDLEAGLAVLRTACG